MNRQQDAFELYQAFSDAEDRFVDEALSDTVAEKIRRDNKRRSLRIRTAAASAAAVIAVVVGLGVIPERTSTMNSALSAERESIANGEHAGGAAAADEAYGNDNVYAEADDAEDEEYNYAAPQEYTEALPEQEIPPTEAAPSETYVSEYQTTTVTTTTTTATTTTSATRYAAPGHAAVQGDNNSYFSEDGTAAADVGEDRTETNSVTESITDSVPEEQAYTYQTVKLSGGEEYALAEEVSKAHRGHFIEISGDYDIYEFDNISSGTMITVGTGDTYRAAVRWDDPGDTLGDLFFGLGFRYYLHCEELVGSADHFGDAEFQSQVWGDIFYAPDSTPRIEKPEEEEGAVSYRCRLGTADETFVSDILISLRDDGILEIRIYDKSLYYSLE